MNPRKNRSRHWIVFQAWFLLLMWLGGGALALAEPPSQPENLRHTVYSSSAAELFWNRPETSGLTYEVQRNGTVVKSTDGVSYFDNQLSAGTDYNYQVIAINTLGERSVPASVKVNTQAGNTTPTQPISTVAAPAGLQATVYSKRSAEIFWNRSATFGMKYEVRRDDKVVRNTDGVSYYDGSLSAGTTYEYQVIAIDLQGARSAPSVVSLTTPGSSGAGETAPVQPATNVAAPSGVRASVYSKNSAEIFWNRSTVFGLSYEIKRDGKVVKTTDGISFYDNQLSAGTTYTYDVVAINEQGERSQPASVMLNTPDGTTPGGTATTPGGTAPNDGTPIAFALDAPPAAAIAEPANYYTSDGYEIQDVIRVDIKTETTPGNCTADDLSGCTLEDLLADVDKRDDLKVEIPVHFSSDDFADDGSINNAMMRMRGSGSRLGAQKSFRIKLDSKQELWRNERNIQLNKSPFDSSRIRNRLAFDIMSQIPHMPSIRTQFVNLWIDDGEGPVDQGLYHHVERPDEDYLKRRGFDPEGNLYDAEDFQFESSDLSDIAVNDDGSPRNEEFFESALGISSGEDHRPVVAMLTALLDPDRSINSVLDQYFDKNNVITWMAVNFLLRQGDAVRHNYYLFNPKGSEKMYFLPWDYDEAMGSWTEPPNNMEPDSLRQRQDFGYAVGEPNVFISQFYRIPGMHQQMVKAVESIRQNYLTDEYIAEKAEKYIRIAEPFQQRAPDMEHNPWFNVSSAEKFARGPADNEQALRTLFSVPMPPTLYQPELQGSEWRFSWKPAYDMTGHSITYELQVSTSPSFGSGDLVVNKTGIKDANNIVEQRIDESEFRSGAHYVRLIARASNDPARFWQISLNRLEQDGTRYYGVLRFDVP